MTKIIPGRAAIYTRISNDPEGRAEGVARQEQDCITLAKKNDLNVVAPTFTDNDISASTATTSPRPAYSDMLHRARQGEFTHILAYSNSRLTRRPLEFEELIKLHESHGIRFLTVVSGEDDLSTADGRMVARIKGNVATAEAERTGERVKRAARGRAESGKFHGGPPPFGYSHVKGEKRIVPNPDEVELIKHAVTRLLDFDDTLYSIIKDWNARGVKTKKGNAWRHATLRATLTNRSLLGETKAAALGWEPILDEVTFSRLRDKLIDPRRKAGNPLGAKSSKYALGGGLTVCGRCGKPLSAISRAEKGNPPIVKLVCRAFINGEHPNHPEGEPQIQRGRVIKTSTGRVVIRHDLLEDYVFEQVLARLEDNEHWQARRTETDPNIGVKIDALTSRRTALEERRERAKEMRLDGDLSKEDYKRETDRIDAELNALDRDRDKLIGRPAVAEVYGKLDKILASWRSWEPGQRRTFLRLAGVEKIVVGDWPSHIPTTTLPKKGESAEAFQLRKFGQTAEAIKQRVQIEWQGAVPA